MKTLLNPDFNVKVFHETYFKLGLDGVAMYTVLIFDSAKQGAAPYMTFNCIPFHGVYEVLADEDGIPEDRRAYDLLAKHFTAEYMNTDGFDNLHQYMQGDSGILPVNPVYGQMTFCSDLEELYDHQ